MGIGQLEIFLFQLIIYSLIYLVDSYVGFLICLILGVIAFALLVLSLIFELVDRSKVPKSYYYFMLNTVFACFLVLIVFSVFMTGSFDWINE